MVLFGDGAGSVLFSSAPFIPRDLLAEMVRRAGVHQYIDAPGDVVRADSRFICIHTKEGGPRKLRLPEACTVSDAFTGAVLGTGASVDLTLPRNSTTLLERIP